MQIKTIRAFTGPNVFHNKPVLRMTLDLEELVDYDSTQLPGFSDLLLKLFPGLAEHGCSSRRPGGFVERLQRGTYLAHIIEHVAIELSESAGIPVTYGKTISAPEPRCYYVVVRYKSEQGMRRLLEMAVELVHALLAGGSFPLAERLEEARHIVEDTELGPSTRALADAATAQGIPWSRISEDNLLRLGYGQYVKYVQAAVSSGTSHIAVGIASNKSLAKQLMAEAGVPVARGTVVETVDQARDLLESLTLPVVVKPLTGNHGNGITMNVDSLAAMTSAFASAQAVNRSVLVEEQLEGKDYRVLVVNGCLVAASHRKVPTVTGNGEHTIEQLITNLNANPRRGEGHEKPLTKVPRDSRLITVLAQQGLGLHDTPARGHSVRLQNTANLSTGATAADVTDEVHPDIRETCERAARAVGLDICGVDLVVPSIAEPYTSGGIIEVNAGPGLRMHMFPESGKPRDVGGAIIDMLYPKKHTGRIPIVSVTGTNGKTTTTRLIGHTLSASGLAVGMTTSDGVYVGGRRVREGDTTGPQSARTVLADRSVEVAVLETARGGLIRGGLGYDWSDVAVITNIQLDHIGQDGLEDINDVLRVKSLVAERVCTGGTLILNADDPTVLRMLQIPRVTRIPKRVVYFTLESNGEKILALREMAESLFYVKDGYIREARGIEDTIVVEISQVPVTFGGMADFQIANVLAATAACRAVGLPSTTIAASLRTFSSEKHNLGRTTLYRLNQGHVLLDYGHNPEAITSIMRFAQRCPSTRRTAVLSLPGDRADALIREAAQIASKGFPRLIIYEDENRRGRTAGEIPRMITAAATQASPTTETRVVLKVLNAVETALTEMIPGEIVVLFCDQFHALARELRQRGAESLGEPVQLSHRQTTVM